MKSNTQTWGEHLKPIALLPLPATPLVSVLIANYNYGRFLGQALESVLEQTYKNFEIVVCDDGSTDESRDILGIYGQKYDQLKVLLQENKGQSEAILAAFNANRGEIICLLDSDDAFLPSKLEEIVAAFAHAPEAGFAVHRLTATDSSLRMLRPLPAMGIPASGWKAPQMSLRSPQMLWCMPPTSGLALRRAVAERVMPHLRDRRFSYADSTIQVVAPLVTPILTINRPLSLYRIHGENWSGGKEFTAADLERLAHQDTELWCAWRSFVMTIVPDLPAGFPIPPEKAPSVLHYACARKQGDPTSKSLYRNVISGPWFASMPRPYRWFWRSSALLPDWLFERAFNFIYGKGRTKLVISRVAHWLRGQRVVSRLETGEAREN